MKPDLWDVRLSTYATYAEIYAWAQTRGIDPQDVGRPITVAVRLPFEAAQAMVERLGFGHSMHQS